MTIIVSPASSSADALDAELPSVSATAEIHKAADTSPAVDPSGYDLSIDDTALQIESPAFTERGASKQGAGLEEMPLDFETSAPFAGNATDVEGLNDEERSALSDWLVSQSINTFLEAKKHTLLGEARTFQAVAMLALDRALFPKRDWDAVLKERGIDPANVTSRHKAAKAVAAAFGLDQKNLDIEARERASNDIDRLALPVEWLTGRILNMKREDRERITFDRDGIETLVQIIKDSGGLNAVAKKQRENNSTPEAERELKIDINLEEGRKLLVSTGRNNLRSQVGAMDDKEELLVCVYVEIGGKRVPAALDPKVIEDLKEKVFAAAAPVDSAVDTLGELFQIGKLVEERETDVPVNNLDDPGDSATKKRLTTRLFVLRPDKSVLISPILAEDRGSPVIIARPKDFAATPPAGALWVLETKGRRKAEANIADPVRRKFFSSSIVDAEGTQGVARLVVTTQAADDKGKRTEDVGVLVQTLRSAAGNLPLDVSASAFKAGFEFGLTATMLRAMAKGLPSRTKGAAKAPIKAKSGKGKSATSAKLSTKGASGTIELGSKTVLFDIQSPTKDGVVRLRADHLLAIVHTLAELPLISHIEVGVDPEAGTRMTFSTKLADYEVYAPALVADGDYASNRYFKVIEAK